MDSSKEEGLNSLNEDDAAKESNISPIKKFVAELIGTAFLVFVVTGIPIFSVMDIYRYNGAFEAAFVLASMIYVFGRISGAHFNPAVSIPMLLRKKITLIECCYYIVAQIIGAFIGSVFVGLCNKGKFKNLQVIQ